MSLKNQDINLEQLLEEVNREFDALIKSEKDKQASLAKSEESKEESKESSKEESKESSKEQSKEEMKKDEEGSGYETPAPEASEEAPQQEEQMPQEQQPEGEEDLNSMVQGLDDEMLHELAQVVQMEIQARQSQQQPEGQPEPQPEMQQEEPAMPPQDAMAMKSEKDLKDKLSKSEEELTELKKAVEIMTSTFEKAFARPVVKAVTDINMVERGSSLKKSELSSEEVTQKVRAITGNNAKLSQLSKSEREVVMDYLYTKKINNQILEIINK
ncbi:MAG TPA: hypothetical protein PKI14_04335 [Fervidobacterium sp.]|nr:hypothetical protein [Fervidobacterium sp.]